MHDLWYGWIYGKYFSENLYQTIKKITKEITAIPIIWNLSAVSANKTPMSTVSRNIGVKHENSQKTNVSISSHNTIGYGTDAKRL